jgi:hypothetical protein
MASHIYVYKRFVIIDNGGEFTVTRYPTQSAILHVIDRLMGIFPINILRSV